MVVGVLAGTVATRLPRVPQADFTRAADLIKMTMDAVLAELRMAEKLARGREKHRRRE